MSQSLVLSESLLNDLLPESSISQEGLQKICDRLPELHRGKKIIGRRNSQTTSTLQSLAMIADSPYRQMKQCLSQINNKRSALIDSHFKVKKNKVKIKLWLAEDTELSRVEAEEAIVQNEELKSGCENSMKEIGMFQDIYEQIRKSHNIPIDWDEADFEESEAENHIRMAFRYCIQRLMETGRIDRGTTEYLEQWGIHPMAADKLTRGYLEDVEKILDEFLSGDKSAENRSNETQKYGESTTTDKGGSSDVEAAFRDLMDK